MSKGLAAIALSLYAAALPSALPKVNHGFNVSSVLESSCGTLNQIYFGMPVFTEHDYLFTLSLTSNKQKRLKFLIDFYKKNNYGDADLSGPIENLVNNTDYDALYIFETDASGNAYKIPTAVVYYKGGNFAVLSSSGPKIGNGLEQPSLKGLSSTCVSTANTSTYSIILEIIRQIPDKRADEIKK